MERISARATPAMIDAIKPGASRRLIADEAVQNLGLMVQPTGSKSWMWTGQIAGGDRPRIGLGRWGAVSVADARDLATEYNNAASLGRDPRDLKREAAEAEAAQDAKTVSATWDAYVKHKTLRREAMKTMGEYRKLVERNVLPTIGERAIHSITRADVKEVINKMLARGAGVQANRQLSLLRTFFDWCVEEELIDANPAMGIKKTREKPRKRFLTLRELGLVWRATEVLDDAPRDAFRLIVLTGARKMESCGAMGREFREGIWTINRERAKMDEPCELPLGPLAWGLVESRLKRDHLFHDAPHKFMFANELDALREEVERLAGHPVDTWRLHSIRHGFRTALTDDDLTADERAITSDAIAEKIISHKAGGISERYSHARMLKSKRRALVAFEQLLMEEVDRQTGANVIALHA